MSKIKKKDKPKDKKSVSKWIDDNLPMITKLLKLLKDALEYKHH